MANQSNQANYETTLDILKYMETIGRKLADSEQKPEAVTLHGEKFIQTGSRLDKFTYRQPIPIETFEAYSLQGFVDYILNDPDELFDNFSGKLIVRVCGPTKVELLTHEIGPQRRHEKIAICHVALPDIPFDRYMDPESMTVTLSTRFAKDEARDLIMRAVGNIKADQSQSVADDGVSQQITVKMGAELQNVKIVNPVPLVPLRTFHEVEQPASPFVLRFDKEGKAALFEADGGAWKYQAVKNIEAWLNEKLLAIDLCADRLEIIA